MVDAVKKSHPGKFQIENRPADKHADELKALGIEDHGVVCMLGDKTLWKHGDHAMSQKEFDAGLTAVLAALK